MTSLISKLGWPVYAGAAGFLVLVLALVYAFGGRHADNPALSNLPPVQTADIQAGFVGEQPFGAWKLICQNLEAPAAASSEAAPKRLCRANARMIVKGPKQQALLAAGFNVLMIDTIKHPAIMFRLPLGARAAATIGFAIDKNTMFTAPIKCSDKECIAQGSLPDDALSQMKEGQVLKLVYTIKDKTQKDRKVRVDQLLYGFPQAFEAMTSAMAS